MKYACLLLMTLTMSASAAVLADNLGKERDAKQAELDAASQATRQTKLLLARANYVEECVETKLLADRESEVEFLQNAEVFLSISLPKLPPSKSFNSAAGKFSMPSSICSFDFSRPSAIQPTIAATASG